MKNKKIIISIIATVLAIAIITVIAFILIKNNKNILSHLIPKAETK